MDTITAVRNRILTLCGERDITIKMICDGLDITLGEFFSTPEFDALEQEIEWPRGAIKTRKDYDIGDVIVLL